MERMQTFAPQTRLFAEPKATAEIIASIPPKTELEIVETVGRYRRVYLSDHNDQRKTGYVVADLLEPIPEEEPVEEEQEQQTQALTRESWWATKGPRFDRATGWLAAGLGLVLLVTIISSVVLWVKIRNLPPPSVHVSCPGSHASNPLGWVQLMGNKLIGVGAGAGEAEVVIYCDLTQKTPGSEICVLFQTDTTDRTQPFAKRNSGQWQQTTCTLIGSMTYEAKLNLDYSQNWTYCIAEKVSGEIVRVGPSQFLDLATQAQHKYIYVQRLEPEQPSELKLRFWQLSTSSEPYSGPIRIKFFTEEDGDSRLEPTFTAVASELVDLGEGRGVAYEIGIEKDSSWKHAWFTVTLADGTTRSTIFRMEEVEEKQIHLFTEPLIWPQG